MVVKSLIRGVMGLELIEVELVLTSGLPQITIVGLPDALIRESAKRIQSALFACGYRMPKAQQVLVNLRPNEIKKTSVGIDLAIALALLWETKQREEPEQPFVVYGELGLDGSVFCPRDVVAINSDIEHLLTGPAVDGLFRDFYQIDKLNSPIFFQAERQQPSIARPEFSQHLFSQKVATYLKVAALGNHSVLLAGPAGSGKTTFCETLWPLMAKPTKMEADEIRRFANYFGGQSHWRPKVNPHHSSSAIALVGGGVPPKPGEVVRSHRGQLILDELLEFHPKAQAALREPIEKGVVFLSRSSYRREFPCQFQLLATTNLCPCGEYEPNTPNRCRCSGRRLRNYLEKLTGPFVDRFEMFLLTQEWVGRSEGVVESEEILDAVEEARLFISQQEKDFYKEPAIMASLSKECHLPTFQSHRRRLSILKVARTIASLERSLEINKCHLQQAYEISYKNFLKLKESV